MVGQRTLTPYVEVRILGPQPETRNPPQGGFRVSRAEDENLEGGATRPSGTAANAACYAMSHAASAVILARTGAVPLLYFIRNMKAACVFFPKNCCNPGKPELPFPPQNLSVFVCNDSRSYE